MSAIAEEADRYAAGMTAVGAHLENPKAVRQVAVSSHGAGGCKLSGQQGDGPVIAMVAGPHQCEIRNPSHRLRRAHRLTVAP